MEVCCSVVVTSGFLIEYCLLSLIYLEVGAMVTLFLGPPRSMAPVPLSPSLSCCVVVVPVRINSGIRVFHRPLQPLDSIGETYAGKALSTPSSMVTRKGPETRHVSKATAEIDSKQMYISVCKQLLRCKTKTGCIAQIRMRALIGSM